MDTSTSHTGRLAASLSCTLGIECHVCHAATVTRRHSSTGSRSASPALSRRRSSITPLCGILPSLKAVTSRSNFKVDSLWCSGSRTEHAGITGTASAAERTSPTYIPWDHPDEPSLLLSSMTAAASYRRRSHLSLPCMDPEEFRAKLANMQRHSAPSAPQIMQSITDIDVAEAAPLLELSREASVELLEQAFALDAAHSVPHADKAPKAPTCMPSISIVQGSATAKGPKKGENQDRLVALQSLDDALAPPTPPSFPHAAAVTPVSAYSAIFDGHGGSEAAAYAARRLQHIVAEQTASLSDDSYDSYDSVDESYCTASPELQQALKTAFSRLDSEFLDAALSSGCEAGSTALAGIHAGTNLIIAHAGDSRAVLCRGGSAVRLTQDHKPENAREKDRIEAAGGKVRPAKGMWRVLLPVEGSNLVKMCATSRGLGDASFKSAALLTCEPDVTCAPLQRHVDEFSIFASDGLWGAVDDDYAVETVKSALEELPAGTSRAEAARRAAEELVQLAQDMGSTDDVSVLINVYNWD